MSMAPGGQFGECVGDEAVINVEVVEWLLKAFMVPLSMIVSDVLRPPLLDVAEHKVD